MIIMGVDPGSKITGYGIVKKDKDKLICLKDGQISPSKGLSFYEKVFHIFLELKSIMKSYKPDEMAIEDIFYSKNIKSFIKLGHIRGAIIIASFIEGIPVFEYTPVQIKRAVVGYGRAPKEQVRSMVKLILNINKSIGFDSSDALAVAICHANYKNKVIIE